MRRGLAWLLASFTVALGCGGDGSGRPDTGYGASQPVPMSVNCQDFCARVADCGAALCDEDTHSMRYAGLMSLLASECQTACTDALLQALTAKWQCLFQSSCRQVFDYDKCDSNGRYSCS